jgi:hypothetical protein
MKIKKGLENEYEEFVKKNKDRYGSCVIRYADIWALYMERGLARGEKIEDISEPLSNDVDNMPGFGITGYMYGAAVSTLARFWEHGEEIRKWHNLNTQIGNEGEIANENGMTLNPAIITINTDDIEEVKRGIVEAGYKTLN